MRDLLTLEEYRDELVALVSPDLRAEDLAIEGAAGRVLAAPVRSRVSVPLFDNSAMDGYAVRYSEVTSVPTTLPVVAEIQAGSALDPVVGARACVRIMTGAPIPSCLDTVIPVEDTDAGVREVTIEARPPARGSYVRRAGGDIRSGSLVAPTGATCKPHVLSAIVATGTAKVRVRPRPVVAVCATGDELVRPGADVRRGQIYESSSIALAAALTRDGARLGTVDSVGDTPAQLVEWLDRVQSDLIILTGGASVGAYDVVRDVLSAAGGTFRHVRMQPGKPQGWAVWSGTPVVALPGNPLSTALSYEAFVRPMLDRILGRPSRETHHAVVTRAWESPEGRRQLVPVRIHTEPSGVLRATPCHEHESASFVVTSMAEADGFVSVPEHVTQVCSGDVLALELTVS